MPPLRRQEAQEPPALESGAQNSSSAFQYARLDAKVARRSGISPDVHSRNHPARRRPCRTPWRGVFFMNPEPRTQNPELRSRLTFLILDSGFWVLDSGFWVLGSGFWVLRKRTNAMVRTL